MAVIEVNLRKLETREKRELNVYIRELRQMDRRRHPPSPAYRALLEEMLMGNFTTTPNLPSWTANFWAEEDIEDPRNAALHDFDLILNNCDLARLSWFIRSGEGQTVREYVKESWSRVTLATASSVYSLFHGDKSVVCFPNQAFEIVKNHGVNDGFERMDDCAALTQLMDRLEIMAHFP